MSNPMTPAAVRKPSTADLHACAIRHAKRTLDEARERRRQLLDIVAKAAQESIKRDFDFSTPNAFILMELAGVEARVRELSYLIDITNGTK